MKDVGFDYFDPREVSHLASRYTTELESPLFRESTKEGYRRLRDINAHFRTHRWPHPFSMSSHRLVLGDARSQNFMGDESVDLVVTSPPYWTLKKYAGAEDQLGDVSDYENFLAELDRVWAECSRVLRPGGRVCCVVGDVCLPRKAAGRHFVMPLHADIQVRARNVGLDCLTPILWNKIANAKLEVAGNGGGYLGKPYQPGGVIKNDIEYILFLRKPGGYRKPTAVQKSLSMLSEREMKSWFRSIWSDIRGASTRAGHPAPYPVELARRLILMFSYAGDTILDPFIGSGTTTEAAILTGRNSIGIEVEPQYFDQAVSRIVKVSSAAHDA